MTPGSVARSALRVVLAALKITLIGALSLATIFVLIVAWMSWGKPLGSYTGQDGDREVAVWLLVLVVVAWLVVAFAVVLPRTRRTQLSRRLRLRRPCLRP